MFKERSHWEPEFLTLPETHLSMVPAYLKKKKKNVRNIGIQFCYTVGTPRRDRKNTPPPPQSQRIWTLRGVISRHHPYTHILHALVILITKPTPTPQVILITRQ